MSFRKFLRFIFENKSEVNRIAGTPNATLTVEVAFQPFLNFLSAHIKIAQRKRCFFLHFKVSGVFTFFHFENKRPGISGFHFHKSVAVGFSVADGLHLVIVNGNFRSRNGFGGQNIGYRNKHSAVTAAFGNDTEVGSHHHRLHTTVVIHVIGSFAGVVALFPIVIVPVKIIVIVRFRHVPPGLLFVGKLVEITHRCIGRHLRFHSATAVKRVFLLHIKLNNVHSARVLFE